MPWISSPCWAGWLAIRAVLKVLVGRDAPKKRPCRDCLPRLYTAVAHPDHANFAFSEILGILRRCGMRNGGLEIPFPAS